MDFYSNNYDLLTGSERSLLHYILDHPQTIQKMTCRINAAFPKTW